MCVLYEKCSEGHLWKAVKKQYIQQTKYQELGAPKSVFGVIVSFLFLINNLTRNIHGSSFVCKSDCFVRTNVCSTKTVLKLKKRLN